MSRDSLCCHPWGGEVPPASSGCRLGMLLSILWCAGQRPPPPNSYSALQDSSAAPEKTWEGNAWRRNRHGPSERDGQRPDRCRGQQTWRPGREWQRSQGPLSFQDNCSTSSLEGGVVGRESPREGNHLGPPPPCAGHACLWRWVLHLVCPSNLVTVISHMSDLRVPSVF